MLTPAYAQHIEQHGKRFFAEICARDREGIVAKRKLGIYKDDAPGWLIFTSLGTA